MVVNHRRLTTLGHHVHTASNGQEAVEAVSERLAQVESGQRAFDLVLMDVVMPVLDGREATRRIRSLESEYGASRMPIVAVTGDVTDGDRVSVVLALVWSCELRFLFLCAAPCVCTEQMPCSGDG